MNYLSIVFLVFLMFFCIVYYIVKPTYRYIVIFIGSYFFYGYTNPKLIFTLIGVTCVSYLGGILIQRKRNRKIYIFSFLLEILILVTFKYTNFMIENINMLSESILSKGIINKEWNLVLPIGLSFMIFQACTYLTDVYKGKIDAEINVIKYGAFVAFFPTVLSGPIQKARELLPQISNPSLFEYEQAKKGTLLFIWGAFEKVVVANNLAIVYTNILCDYVNRSSAEVLIGAMSFSLYIYADFLSYSDMARGLAKILGINVGINFKNPYLSQSMSEFWNRWHISLNEWFVENVYIPLGGNRKGNIRKYVNVLIVFFISGLWHGAYWHFIVWGILNGILAIVGQILRPIKKKLYMIMKIDEKVESVILLKRAGVFYLITLTWVFFTVGIKDALNICSKIIFFDIFSIFDPGLLNVAGNAIDTIIITIATVIFCGTQFKRQDERSMYDIYNKQPYVFQCLLMAVLICICVFGACVTDASVDMQFLYFQF